MTRFGSGSGELVVWSSESDECVHAELNRLAVRVGQQVAVVV